MLDGPQPTGVNDPSLTNAEVNELVPESIFSGETAGKSRAFSGHLKPEEPPVPKPVKIEPFAPFAWDDDLYSVLQKASEWTEVKKRFIVYKESTAQEEAPWIQFSTVSNDAECLEVLNKLVESSVSSKEKIESYPVNALPLSCATLDITLYPVRLIRTNFRVRIWMQYCLSLKKSDTKRVVKSTKSNRSFPFLVSQVALDTSSLEVQSSKNYIYRIFWDKYQGNTMLDPNFYNQPIAIQSRR